MAKREISQKETKLSHGNSVGTQVEQTLTLDDCCLQSAQELQAYQAIDPRLVDLLIDSAKKEQSHRHKIDNDKVEIIKKSEKREGRMNWWGMFFAFLSIIVLCSLTALALYLDKPWFATLPLTGMLLTVASIFVRRSEGRSSKNNQKK